MQKFDLTGKVGLITGATGLMGVEHARALLECNANVVLTDINVTGLRECREKLLDEYPGREVKAFEMDVAVEEQVRNIAEMLYGDGVLINILINNAAIDPKFGDASSAEHPSRLEAFSLDSWDFQLGVGLTGAFLCTKIFGSQMAERGEPGVIINVASDLSVIAPDQRLYSDSKTPLALRAVKPVTYSVIKSGLLGLTRYTATYWCEAGIRCNAISPGGIDNEHDESFKKKLTERIPLGRMASRSEYRGAIQFLSSDASQYMTGQNLIIDGGRTVW